MVDLARKRVIAALDFPSLQEAQIAVKETSEEIEIYKVGLELFLNTDGKIIDYLHNENKEVFLDLKFHDIENTVLQACKYAMEKNVFLFNIHAAVGEKTMQAVAKYKNETGSKSKIISVTMLTNLSDEDAKMLYGENASISSMVGRFAGLTAKSGLDGVVCSAREASFLKEEYGEKFLTVCPGIRPLGADIGDQSRVMTPEQAIFGAADYLVVGRPIMGAKNRAIAAKQIIDEVALALEKMEG